jgi:hypothetical protein
MAGIVKKIGKITKYETTEYVGGARMLDLDARGPESMTRSDRQIEGERQTGEFTSSPAGGTDVSTTPFARRSARARRTASGVKR